MSGLRLRGENGQIIHGSLPHAQLILETLKPQLLSVNIIIMSSAPQTDNPN